MFEPKGPGLELFQKRYAISPEETWEKACKRLSRQMSLVEQPENIEKWKNRFFEELSENRFMPAGRIWFGAGRPKGAMINCFVIPTEDSREGWGKTVSDMIVISGMGGGVGVNFTPIRPRGMPIKGVGGEATGSVSLMHIINAAGEVIKAGGGRRVALMFNLSLDHPDIEEFLNKKLDLKELNNANISILIPYGKQDEFIEAVKKDKMWKLVWQDKVVKEIPAKELWEKIVDNALKCGEPGILNAHYANYMNNIYYCRELISTNPCSELFLSAQEACCLGSIVLPRFIKENGELDKESLSNSITVAVRFLDNVLDVTTYPNNEIKQNCQELRRIGLGIMGLHDTLIKMGLKYGSQQALDEVNKIMKFIRNRAYEASCFLAVEKGVFPAFDRELYLKGNFIKTLSAGLQSKIKEYGIRNCALISLAPTGTTSIVAGTSSGIEPIFAKAYKRRYNDGIEKKEEIWTHPLYEEYVKRNKDTKLFISAHELTPKEHLMMQITCQTWTDNSLSKTINIPKKHDKKEISKLLLDHLHEIKGVTIYVDGSRGESPLEVANEEDVLKSLCPSGACSL